MNDDWMKNKEDPRTKYMMTPGAREAHGLPPPAGQRRVMGPDGNIRYVQETEPVMGIDARTMGPLNVWPSGAMGPPPEGAFHGNPSIRTTLGEARPGEMAVRPGIETAAMHNERYPGAPVIDYDFIARAMDRENQAPAVTPAMAMGEDANRNEIPDVMEFKHTVSGTDPNGNDTRTVITWQGPKTPDEIDAIMRPKNMRSFFDTAGARTSLVSAAMGIRTPAAFGGPAADFGEPGLTTQERARRSAFASSFYQPKQAPVAGNQPPLVLKPGEQAFDGAGRPIAAGAPVVEPAKSPWIMSGNSFFNSVTKEIITPDQSSNPWITSGDTFFNSETKEMISAPQVQKRQDFDPFLYFVMENSKHPEWAEEYLNNFGMGSPAGAAGAGAPAAGGGADTAARPKPTPPPGAVSQAWDGTKWVYKDRAGKQI